MNGAGKTSLFRMITGHSLAGSGSMHVLNVNATNRAKVARLISYCRQVIVSTRVEKTNDGYQTFLCFMEKFGKMLFGFSVVL